MKLVDSLPKKAKEREKRAYAKLKKRGEIFYLKHKKKKHRFGKPAP